MNSLDLYKIIFEFIKNPNYKAILIGGPWGCGKSFQVQKVLEDYNKAKNSKNNKILMTSVFGFETIDEIHTNLYTKLYPKIATAKRIFKSTFGIISKAIDLIPNPIGIPVETVKNITEAISNEIDNKEELKSDTIVILDDIERLSSKIEYLNLYGYICKLIEQGIKIICICDSSKISDKNQFMQFKEKIFERVYKINTPTIEVIKSFFENYDFLITKQIIDEFNFNIRLANKVHIFFDEVIFKLNKSYKNYTEKYPYELFLNCCINVIKEEFPNGNNNDIKHEGYGDEELTKCLKSIYLHNDYTSINSLLTFYEIDIQKIYPEILKKQFFLLSDSNKDIYI